MKQTLLILILTLLLNPYCTQGRFQTQIGVSFPTGVSAIEIETYGLGYYNVSTHPISYLHQVANNQRTYGFSKGLNIGVRYTDIQEHKKIGYYFGANLFYNKLKKSSSDNITRILSGGFIDMYRVEYKLDYLKLPVYYNIPFEFGLHILPKSSPETNDFYINMGLIINIFHRTKLRYKGSRIVYDGPDLLGKSDYEHIITFPIQYSIGAKIEMGLLIKKHSQIGISLFSFNPLAYTRKNDRNEDTPFDLFNVHFAYIFKARE